MGKEIETKARVLSILALPFPDDNREGWVDLGRGVIVYNIAHPFAKIYRGIYNMLRVVISTLIKDATEKESMDAKQGLEMQEKLLHLILL